MTPNQRNFWETAGFMTETPRNNGTMTPNPRPPKKSRNSEECDEMMTIISWNVFNEKKILERTFDLTETITNILWKFRTDDPKCQRFLGSLCGALHIHTKPNQKEDEQQQQQHEQLQKRPKSHAALPALECWPKVARVSAGCEGRPITQNDSRGLE